MKETHLSGKRFGHLSCSSLSVSEKEEKWLFFFVLIKHRVQTAESSAVVAVVVVVLRKSLKSIQLSLYLSNITNKSEKSSGILLIPDGLDLTHQPAQLLLFRNIDTIQNSSDILVFSCCGLLNQSS